MLVEIRGKTYECNEISDLEVFPLLKVFGEPAPEDDAKYKVWLEGVNARLSGREARESLADFLTSVIPTIPESIAFYRVYQTEKGRQVEASFKLNTQEVVDIINQLEPMFSKLVAKPKPKVVAGLPTRKRY